MSKGVTASSDIILVFPEIHYNLKKSLVCQEHFSLSLSLEMEREVIIDSWPKTKYVLMLMRTAKNS